jgi:BlaI family transcriptional regulator, penicillinase repressor
MTIVVKPGGAAVIRISDAEWQVLSLLWERHPLTSSEIIEALSPRTGWRQTTIKTLLKRLVEKGAVRYEEQGHRYLYSPKLSREECVLHESRSFLKRVFEGDPQSLLTHFVRTSRLSACEIEQLKRILDEKEGA